MQPMYHQQAIPVQRSMDSYPVTQQPPIADSYPADNAYASAPQQYAPHPSHPAHAIVNSHDSDYGGWMGPAAGGAAVGAAAGYIGTQAHHQHQIEQQERAEQEELDRQAEYQRNQASQAYAVQQSATTGFVSPPPVVPERDPDHHAPAAMTESTPGVHPTLIPTPVMAAGTTREPTDSHLNSTTMSPSTGTSFLDESEVGAAPFGATSGKTVNGGPVPVELVDLADEQAHPSVRRTNTDISVSDLHVPGEYPKGQVKVAPALKEEDVVQM